MYVIGEVLVSDEIASERFVCDLTACKGACCWEGDFGAPLEAEELPVLEQVYESVRPYMSPAGIAEVEKQGHYVEDREGVVSTPLIQGGPCAYMVFDSNGIAKCAIEQAYLNGEIDFHKPISCHLYPIRISRNPKSGFEALNYDRWDICSAACSKGNREKVAIYQFTKAALVRKYGEEFWNELDAMVKAGH